MIDKTFKWNKTRTSDTNVKQKAIEEATDKEIETEQAIEKAIENISREIRI